MKCPNCGTKNQDTANFCRICGTQLAQSAKENTDSANWQRDAYLDDSSIPTMYIPDEEQRNTVLVNPPPPGPNYNFPYMEVYDGDRPDPSRKNNMLLLTVLLGILTVVLAICVFLVVKSVGSDRTRKEPAPSGAIAIDDSTGRGEPVPSVNEDGTPAEDPSSYDEPATSQASSVYYPPSAHVNAESIMEDYELNPSGNSEETPEVQEPEIREPEIREPEIREPETREREKKETGKEEDRGPTTGHYIIPYSNTQYLTESDLRSLSEWDLKLARNEIYARHGREFKDPALQEYFDAQSWYVRRYDPEEFDKNHNDELSALEKKNAEFILQYEKDHGLMT